MKEYGMSGSKPKKKASSLSASKVSPKVITQIKTLGMTKALASAKSNKGNKAYIAGLTRMYGAKRVNAALGYKAGAGTSRPVGGVMGSSKYKNVMGGSSSTVAKSKPKSKLTSAQAAWQNRIEKKKKTKKSGPTYNWGGTPKDRFK